MSDEKVQTIANLLKELIVENSNVQPSISDFIKFDGDISGKGLIWYQKKSPKQFIFRSDQEGFLSSENISLARGKNLQSNGIILIDENSLGNSITKSNLKELGRLRGLLVDGSINVSQYLIFDHHTNRLGLGTEQPNNTISILEEGTEVIIGPNGHGKGSIGTFNHTDFEILTDNTTRITINAGGNIELGNKNNGPIKVSVLGSLGINVNSIDSRANLHVNGPIKFNDKIHMASDSPPQGGSFVEGDIVWNNNPKPRSYVGWICTRSGNPGLWNPFGEIKERE